MGDERSFTLNHKYKLDTAPNSSPGWFSWLSGFVDGEGSFCLRSRSGGKYFSASVRISLRRDDRKILCEINDILGCGNVYDLSVPRGAVRNAKPQSSWECGDIPSLSNIIVPTFDKYTLRAKKRNDYLIWRGAVLEMNSGHMRRGVGRKYVEKLGISHQYTQKKNKEYIDSNTRNVIGKESIDVDPSWYSWLSGFIDGEGAFGLSYEEKTGYIRPNLRIGLREDDSSILYEIRDTTQCGRVYIDDKYTSSILTQSPVATWKCQDMISVNKIISILDHYPLRSKKKMDYNIWREAVISMGNGSRYGKDNFRYADLIKNSRRYRITIGEAI